MVTNKCLAGHFLPPTVYCVYKWIFWFDAINFGKATVHTLGCQVIVFNSSVFLSEDLFYLTNSIDLDEMPHNVAFHLGLHCL